MTFGSATEHYAGNGGEWSEIYVLLRLLADGKIYQGDEHMKRTDVYATILKVLRKESVITEYDRDKDGNDDEVVHIIINDEEQQHIHEVRIDSIQQGARLLKERIPKLTSKNNTIPEIESLLEEMLVHSIKAASISSTDNPLYNGKNDIVVETKDEEGSVRTAGYSIKSFLSSQPPTLFNTAPASGAVYWIKGATHEDMLRFNISYIDSFLGRGKGGDECRIRDIMNNPNYELVPLGFWQDGQGKQPFTRNLQLSGLDLPEIIQYLQLYRYGYRKGKECLDETSDDVSVLVERMIEDNPVEDVMAPQAYYPARVKSFLFDVFAGMTATNQWDGKRKVGGGYIDVKSNGDVLYYPARSDDNFTTYLFDNVHLESPSHGYRLYEAALLASQELPDHGGIDAVTIDGLKQQLAKKKKQANSLRSDYGYAYETDAYPNHPKAVCIRLNTCQIRFKKLQK
ncbi:HpaII family restriction endonuclease [Pseudoscardovia suis]